MVPLLVTHVGTSVPRIGARGSDGTVKRTRGERNTSDDIEIVLGDLVVKNAGTSYLSWVTVHRAFSTYSIKIPRYFLSPSAIEVTMAGNP